MLEVNAGQRESKTPNVQRKAPMVVSWVPYRAIFCGEEADLAAIKRSTTSPNTGPTPKRLYVSFSGIRFVMMMRGTEVSVEPFSYGGRFEILA